MKDKKYLDMSNKRLQEFCRKKITTTMIGSLDIVEKNLGSLLDDIDIREKFDLIRQQILDNGNKQIRSLDKEFTNYEIELLRYHVTLITRNQEK
jgi:hypothetical protein